MPRLSTERLELVPITLPMVEAVMQGDRARAEAVAEASLPEAWPGEALIARAFGASLEAIRSDPTRRLWGDTLLISRDPARRVLGSVVFHGLPADGVAEVGYGVEEESQGQGYATEATRACVAWALAQDGIHAVAATVFSWNRPSLRVVEKLGMAPHGVRDHETLGELLTFILRRT
ncbi:MAG: GNAT family N-acetyltransferase [Deltaproteobacteria bacterium]|nr:GNAT family N-acetyltransferase [Deltaproteobacteria bacterium]